MRHRGLIACLCIAGLAAFQVSKAQAPRDPNAFRNGITYTFERTFATRVVNDAYDRGSISIAVYIWRPITDAPRKIAFFSHGSLGGMAAAPQEPIQHVPPALVEFLVRRGYTVVAPTRRGLGASTGTYREECEFSAGRCSLAEYRALMVPGLQEAVADSNAVIDQIIQGKEAPRGAKMLQVGISRGGYLALRMAADRPELTRGVIAFVPGWLSLNEAWPAEELKMRAEAQQRSFREMGSRTQVPTLWIYGARDPFYGEAATREFFEAFRGGGGAGSYVFVPEHSLRSGHLVATEPKLWEDDFEAYVGKLQ